VPQRVRSVARSLNPQTLQAPASPLRGRR
jgi:hypothetical protein